MKIVFKITFFWKVKINKLFIAFSILVSGKVSVFMFSLQCSLQRKGAKILRKVRERKFTLRPLRLS
mgnify:CR=1 FL=1